MGDRATAVQLFNQGITASADKSDPKNPEMAFQLFAAACLTDPTWGYSHYMLGNSLSDIKKPNAAVAFYRRALQCEKDEHHAKLLSNLGWKFLELGRVNEAHSYIRKALELDPKLANAWTNLSMVLGTLGDSIGSVGAAKTGVELEPDNDINHMALAFAYLFDRQFAKGLGEFEARFRYRLHAFLQYPYPEWQGEKGHTVFLVADQGLGDTLSFSRFVEPASQAAGYIHMYVQAELMRAFTHAFMHLPNVNILPYAAQCPFPQADSWSTFVSLPHALGLTDKEIRQAPDISLPLFQSQPNWKIPGRDLHIGITWAGSPLNDIDRHRCIPLTFFSELCEVEGVQLYSLQVGDRGGELHTEGYGGLIRDLTPYIRDVVDTVSILPHLDLVITCESALGHICSAAGKECWVPYSYLGRDYRIGHTGEDRLWTPKHRIFRQGPDQKWDGPFAEIRRALADRVRNKRDG